MWNIDEKKLQSILDEATSTGEECGCQLAIFSEGKQILSLVSGYTGPDRTTPVTENSLFPIFSCGKGIMATTVHMLKEKGILDYNERIAHYWPAFGKNGKEDIRLWQVMSHRTGLHNLPDLPDFALQGDWEYMCRAMEEATPAVEVGTKCCYQGSTHAWLVGETIRQATGKSMRQIIQEEILRPLGLEESLFFGTTPEADARCVQVDDSTKPDSWCHKYFNTLPIRHGFMPSANGIATATALAKHYSAVVCETDGVKLLKDETLEEAVKLCRDPNDVPLESTWARFALGYALPGNMETLHYWFGHGGALGAEGFGDRKNKMAYAFVKNKDLVTHPVHPVRSRLSEALGLPDRVW